MVRLFVVFPATPVDFAEKSEQIESTVGIPAVDSGFGMGHREMTFEFGSVPDALTAESFLHELGVTGLQTVVRSEKIGTA